MSSRIRDEYFDEIPENPLKKWKSQFDSNNLTPLDFVQYFQLLSPNFFNIGKGTEITNIGKLYFFRFFDFDFNLIQFQVKVFFKLKIRMADCLSVCLFLRVRRPFIH